MKQLLLLLAICLTTLTACAQNKPSTAAKQTVGNSVEVLYFHGKQRCPTCRAIEANTKATLDSAFANELKKRHDCLPHHRLFRTGQREDSRQI